MSTNTKPYKKYIIWFWGLYAAGLLIALFVFFSASLGWLGHMPSFEHLENPKTNLASQVISSDGVVLSKYYLNENRTPITFSDLNDNLVNALVATEDIRFYNHSGIDTRGFLRAVFGKLTFRNKGGASTISQQVARQLFVGIRAKDWKKYTQKIREWVIAVQLERNYTKEEIIAMYFNIYDFANNADGIRSAAKIYFNKKPNQLKQEEAAMLVGMFKRSYLYNPKPNKNPVGTKNRRNVVLAQMATNGFISNQEKDSLQKLPIKLNFNPESHNDGLATYFRGYLKTYLKDWIKNNPKPALPGENNIWNLYLDGLKIYTTIDSRMQQNAEDAVAQHMTQLQAAFFKQNTPTTNPTAPFLRIDQESIDAIMNRGIKQSDRWRILKEKGKTDQEIKASFYIKRPMTVFDWQSENNEKDTIFTPLDSIRYYKSILRTAMMSLEPQTGNVKAWVGGINYRHFKYDNVIQGGRQAGSTFKPFVYTVAIDQLGLSPCFKLPDTQHCIAPGKHGNLEAWCPDNSSGTFSGELLTLKNALANSVNSTTARLMDDVGPKPVIQLAKKMGISTTMPEYPSIALGTPSVKLFDMVGAYGVFANKGVYVKPVLVTRIEDKNGIVLYENTPQTKDVLSEDVAYTMVNLMEGVTTEGSGARLRNAYNKNNPLYKEIITGYPYNFTNPIAGKTGTTQNQSDGWFMGMVPNLVTGVWVGGENTATHFKKTSYGAGASMALPIWALYMKKNYANTAIGISTAEFEKPVDLKINLDCETTIQDGSPDDDLDDIRF